MKEGWVKNNKLTQVSDGAFKKDFANHSRLYADFLCECGRVKELIVTKVRSGSIKSCGCLKYGKMLDVPKNTRTPPNDLSGQRFGAWTVISYYGDERWRCVCDCGVERNIIGSTLKNGSSVSCGCKRKEMLSANVLKHGMSHTRMYGIWANIKDRCLNPKYKHWEFYGGRGITICDRWIKFENFLEDMGERPGKLSVERLDVNGPYCKENCVWANATQQQRNRRCTVMLEIDGHRKPLTEWAEMAGIASQNIRRRLRDGWPVKEAVFSPSHAGVRPGRGPKGNAIVIGDRKMFEGE